MIITLLAWLYITFLCWMWGGLLLGYFQRKKRQGTEPQIHACITCFIGLAGILTFSSLLSLFMPLGGYEVQLLLIGPCMLYAWLKPSQALIANFRTQLYGLSVILKLLLFIIVILLLLLSTSSINNEDTLSYHAQIIQWIEKYKAVPGIANLHIRYGLQSSWFVGCAAFGFRFIGTNALSFLNSVVVLWYFIFIISQLNKNYRDKKNTSYGFGWLAILLLSLWSYSQVRLTATSASPDFITILYCWLCFYLLFNAAVKELSARNFSLIICLGAFALTLKLSAIPVIILSLYSCYKLFVMKNIRVLLFSLLISIAVFLPFIARNIITSGYPFFPSRLPDMVNTDWKLSTEKIIYIQKYITAYARIRSGADPASIDGSLSMNMAEWIPVWWKNQSLADKSIIILLVLSFCFLIIRIKGISASPHYVKVALVTALGGVLFWFIQAPDPRFGFGFIVSVIAIIFWLEFQNNNRLYGESRKRIFIVMSLVTALVIGGYSVYRGIYFFSPSQLLTPAGPPGGKYSTIYCNNFSLTVPSINYGCGTAQVPCAYDSCQSFEARGKSIEDGFRAK
jgi:hypothetical protein